MCAEFLQTKITKTVDYLTKKMYIKIYLFAKNKENEVFLMNNNENPDDRDPYNFFKLSTEPEEGGNGDKNGKMRPRLPFWGLILIVLGVVAILNIFLEQKPENLIDFSEFTNKIETGDIVEVELGENYYIGYGPKLATIVRKDPSWRELLQGTAQSNRTVYRTSSGNVILTSFMDLLAEKEVTFRFASKQNNYLIQLLINLILPFGFIFLMYYFIFRKIGGGLGGMGSIFGAGSNRAKAVDEGKVKTRFSDVAGVDEAKEELMEVVDFLKSPQKYTEIGGRIPKGVLLVGPPGTGKTLLARAVAGEAGVPFFRISGSDFVEMFVGVGASRVRDLFKQAHEKTPCIIFIDELDAIGKSRVNNLGGNDEREQTLNQLLVEMDGFDNEKGLIILAATNRPDILDPALLRPGRFDRQVVVDRPDVTGREAILKIHAKNVKLDSGVNFNTIAHETAGFAGADLANIVNEAALLAVRGGRKLVSMQDFDEAIEKTIVGLQKKTHVVKEVERKITAYHETGHALVAAFTEGSDPVHKITIIPRGMGVGGFTMQLPQEDTYLKTEKQLLGEVDVLLGGRASEQIVFSEISTGASNDIQRATDIIRSMISDYGMSEKFRNMTLGKHGKGYDSGEPSLVREYSEDTQKYIDTEIARIMEERYNYVLGLLSSKRDLLEYVAKLLLDKETVDGKEFNEIIKAHNHAAELQIAAVTGGGNADSAGSSEAQGTETAE